MKILKYHRSDLKEIIQLFYDTVHTINSRDYTEAQVNAWATGKVDHDEWDSSFQKHITYVAKEGDMITGFGDIDATGYLDRLYVHKDLQGRGIATALCDKLEKETAGNIIRVHASITAKRFFENRGYTTVRQQEVERQGISLTNYVMEKQL